MGSTMASPIECNIPRWTAEAALRLLPETPWPRHEVIDASLAVTPSPGFAHQRATSRLSRLLDDAAPGTVEVFGGLNVVLPAGLTGGGYTSIATAGPGQRLVTDRPFTLTLNPADLRAS